MRREASLPQRPAPRAGLELRAILSRVLAIIGTDGGLLGLLLLALAALIRQYGVSFVWAEGPITISGAIGVGLILFHFVLRLPELLRDRQAALANLRVSIRQIARDWAPFIGLMWAFESLETYSARIPKRVHRRHALLTRRADFRRRAHRMGPCLSSAAAHRLDGVRLR